MSRLSRCYRDRCVGAVARSSKRSGGVLILLGVLVTCANNCCLKASHSTSQRVFRPAFASRRDRLRHSWRPRFGGIVGPGRSAFTSRLHMPGRASNAGVFAFSPRLHAMAGSSWRRSAASVTGPAASPSKAESRLALRINRGADGKKPSRSLARYHQGRLVFHRCGRICGSRNGTGSQNSRFPYCERAW